MYQEFARVYDEFMETIPYTTWADYIEQVWHRFDEKPNLVLDMACGTGGLAVELSLRGYDMIGTDLSEDMLQRHCQRRRIILQVFSYKNLMIRKRRRKSYLTPSSLTFAHVT